MPVQNETMVKADGIDCILKLRLLYRQVEVNLHM